MHIVIPEPSLVVLVGPTGSGKSTFAARFFRQTEIVSSDHSRGLVSDDENDQSATPAAFRIVHAITRERLRLRRMTVVDATNVRTESRKPLVAIARNRGVPALAIVFDVPQQLCVERNAGRSHRSLPGDVVHRQHEQMRASLPGLAYEGFHRVYVLGSAESVDAAVVLREGSL